MVISTHAFTYDDVGNRLTFDENGTAITYAGNLVNEYTDIDGDEPEYDDAGNLTKDAAGYAYFYDAENRLTRIEDSSSNAVAAYRYDAFSRRIERIDYAAEPDVTRRYFYDSQLRVLQEYEDGSAQKSYVWGSYVDELLAIDDDPGQADGFEYYVCRDHLYSVAAIVDTGGGIVERYEYDVYGEPTIYTGNGGDGDWWDGDESSADAPTVSEYLFTGRRYDAFDDGENVFSIMYYRARYYDPDTGRFMSRDPLGMMPDGGEGNAFEPLEQYRDGMNLYEYVTSKPVILTDANGLACGSGFWQDLFIPDHFMGVSFNRACRNHDQCYDGLDLDGGCDKPRSECDSEFYDELLTACERAQPYDHYIPTPGGMPVTVHYTAEEVRRACRSRARLYSYFVDNYGDQAFQRARDRNCQRRCPFMPWMPDFQPPEPADPHDVNVNNIIGDIHIAG